MSKRLCLVLLLLVCAAPVYAQQPSVTMQALPNSGLFLGRVQILMAQQARAVLLEASSDATHNGSDTGANATDLNYTNTCHGLRTTYAKGVLANLDGTARLASVLLASANFADAVIVNTVTGSGNTADSTAADAALTNAIKHNWSTWSGCVINP